MFQIYDGDIFDAILHLLGAVYLGGAHRPLGRVESDKLLPGLSQRPQRITGGLAFQELSAIIDNPTYRLLGFENKLSPPLEFETGARIAPPVTES